VSKWIKETGWITAKVRRKPLIRPVFPAPLERMAVAPFLSPQ